MEELSDYLFRNRFYQDAHGIDLLISPQDTVKAEEYRLYIVQTSDRCEAKIHLRPAAFSKSKIVIFIYAENSATVDCICTLDVPKDVNGIETDIQIRSWPFDRSKISARPEMKIANSNIVATHGNALGTLSNEERYYLATKGIKDYKELIKQSLLENANPIELLSLH